MDYEKFYAIYPSLRTFREQITLLGEDPATQTDLGMIGEYTLNSEISIEEATTRNTEQFGARLHTKKFIVIQS